MACSLIGISANTPCFDACTSYEHAARQMSALSIKQPFASLVVFGIKPLEIRSRQTHYRGQIVVCASRQPYPGMMHHPERQGVILPAVDYVRDMGELAPVGQAVGMVDIVGCRPMRPEDAELALVDYRPGLWAWELANPVEIDPFPVVGQLGLFKVNAGQIRVKTGLK